MGEINMSKSERQRNQPLDVDTGNNVETEQVEKPVEETKEPSLSLKVINCEKLNVRAEPMLTSKILGTASGDTLLVTAQSARNLAKIKENEFVPVSVPTLKLNGFVMRKFVQVKTKEE